MEHPTPYKIFWVFKGHQVLMNEKCILSLQIGSYMDDVICDIIPMDVCHILLVRPWNFDIRITHGGRWTTYTIMKDGKRFTLSPLRDREEKVDNSPKVMLVEVKEFMKVEKKDVFYEFIPYPIQVVITTKIIYLPLEIQNFWNIMYTLCQMSFQRYNHLWEA